MQTVYFKKLVEDAKIPEFQSENAVGADLHSVEDVIIEAGSFRSVKTGLATEFPPNLEMQVRGRSGLAFKNGVMGFFGTIDGDYRGEIGVLLFNLGNEDFKVSKGDRIGQIVMNEVPICNFKVKKELSETDRGTGGFGSTGK
jgi:dUTP pyrophosphatase